MPRSSAVPMPRRRGLGMHLDGDQARPQVVDQRQPEHRVADRAGPGPSGQVDPAPVGPHVPEPVDQVGQQRRRVRRPVHRGRRGLDRVHLRELVVGRGRRLQRHDLHG
jgi:hypothetical protein